MSRAAGIRFRPWRLPVLRRLRSDKAIYFAVQVGKAYLIGVVLARNPDADRYSTQPSGKTGSGCSEESTGPSEADRTADGQAGTSTSRGVTPADEALRSSLLAAGKSAVQVFKADIANEHPDCHTNVEVKDVELRPETTVHGSYLGVPPISELEYPPSKASKEQPIQGWIIYTSVITNGNTHCFPP